jgi:hypothetical protein
MEATRSSETFVLTRATRRRVPEDGILHKQQKCLRQAQNEDEQNSKASRGFKSLLLEDPGCLMPVSVESCIVHDGNDDDDYVERVLSGSPRRHSICY